MLSPRHKKFAELYFAGGNATEAYGEVYGTARTATGKFPGWVGISAHRLLRNPLVREELDRMRGEASKLATMELQDVIDFLTAAINTPIEEIGPESPLCEEMTTDENGKVKVKSISKAAAIRELARLTGMGAAKKIEITAESELVDMVKRLTGARDDE